MDTNALNQLLQRVYPPSMGEAILTLLATRAGQVVSLEEMAIAAYGDRPDVWEYSNLDSWAWNVGSCISKIRRRLYRLGERVDIEAVRGRGYKLVERKARRRLTRADMQKRKEAVLKQYDALMAEYPQLSIRQARDRLAPTLRHSLPHGTLKTWLRQRQPERSAP